MNDCAFSKNGECIALNEMQCNNCVFRKTNEELLRGRQKALTRVRNLPRALRTVLIRRYHQRKEARHGWSNMSDNTRGNHYITYQGETLSLTQWAKRYNLNINTLQARLTRYGWTVERALTEGVTR